MLGFDIVDGVGLLRKQQFVKPYWYGITDVGLVLENSQTAINNLQTACTAFDDTKIQDLVDKRALFTKQLTDIYSYFYLNNNGKISYNNPDSKLYNSGINVITPTYISSLGPYSDNSTDLGKINKDYLDTFEIVYKKYVEPVVGLCVILQQSTQLTTSLNSISAITGTLEESMSTITDDVVQLLNDYKNYITEYLFGTFLGLNIVSMIFIFVEGLMIIFYANRNYNLLRKHIICLWSFIGFMLVFFFIFAGIFGIVAALISDVADIVDFIFANENLQSDKPRIISQDENLQNIDICLRGNGDLLTMFVKDDDTKQYINYMNRLFNMYYPIEKYKALSQPNIEKNEFNTLSSIEEYETKLQTYRDDFSLATTYQDHGGLDMSTQFEELNKYTVYGKYYQEVCNNRLYDYFVSTKDKCPSNTDYNCLLITDIISINRYSSGRVCEVVTSKSPSFTTVQSAYTAFSDSIKDFKTQNDDIIKKILKEDTSGPSENIIELKAKYEACVREINTVLTNINDDIIGPIYETYKNYVNLEELESGEEVNVFSWMNCTVFGKDLNATLNIMKKHFKKDLQNIFIITLINNGILISQMIIITFIINWYKYDPLENNPVGEMEINEKKIGDDGKEIKEKEKIEYEEEEEEEDDDDEEEEEEETDHELYHNSQSLNDNKKKNEIDSPERIEVNNNKGVNNNFVNDHHSSNESDNNSESDFKLKMMNKLNKNNGN
jgi:hypothetical protein